MQLLNEKNRPPDKGNWRDKIFELAQQKSRLDLLKNLSPDAAFELKYNWFYHARNEQWEPSGADWFIWAIIAGRGFGKTRSGAEWVNDNARAGVMRQALVGSTAADVRKVMIEGESGILACARPDFKPVFKGHLGQVIYPNGAILEAFSAERPDRLRGPQFEAAWCDELAAWTRDRDTWDMLNFTVRIGSRPRILITTTPKPRPLLKEILKGKNVITTRGSTYDNQHNLSSIFIDVITDKYKGTRLGRQELMAEMLEDVEGALWTRANIEKNRVTEIPPLKRVVISVDPSVTNNKMSDAAGITAQGLGYDGLGYLLADKTMKGSPAAWAKVAIALFHELKADSIIAESNNGGDLIKFLFRTIDPSVPVRLVHASRGKKTRAEPCSALSEQDKIKFFGTYPDLEDELCTWTGELNESSPNRFDAFVWGFTELMLKRQFNFQMV